jgi:hypothetical protein
MAQATFVKSARKTIYEKGAVAEYISEKGKREGQIKLFPLMKTIKLSLKRERVIIGGSFNIKVSSTVNLLLNRVNLLKVHIFLRFIQFKKLFKN